MSLINQMLKDLASRTKPVTSPEVLLSELMTRMKGQTKRNKLDWLIYGTIIFLMIMITLLIIQKLLGENDSEKVVAHPVVVIQENQKTKYPKHVDQHPKMELAQLNAKHEKNFPAVQIELDHKKDLIKEEVIVSKPKEIIASPPIQKTNLIKKAIAYSKEDEFEEARTFLSQGRNNEAIQTLTNILANDPEFFSARDLLATIFYEQGNFEKANAVLKKGLQQRPLYPPYVRLTAEIMMTKGRLNEALNLLQEAPPTLKEYPEYHALLAALYQRIGKPDYAEGLYEKLLTLQPDNVIWWLGLGIARESMNKKFEALDAFAKADADGLTPELRNYVESRISHLQG
jgi:tetratricopeptide (TPR) repeat protein